MRKLLLASVAIIPLLVASQAQAAPAIPLIAAAAGYGATAGLAAIGIGGIAGALGGFLVSTAINQIGGRATTKKPKGQSGAQEAAGRTQIVRSSVDSHKIVYGTSRVSGPLVFVETTDSSFDNFGAAVYGDNKWVHLIIPLAGHEVEEIGTVYLNDTPLVIDSNGWVLSAPYYITSTSKSYVRVQKMLGSPDQEANQIAITNMSQFQHWTANHRLRGLPYLYVQLEFSNDVFPTGIPNVSAVVKGRKVYDPRTGLTQWTDNAALCIRDYLAGLDPTGYAYGFGCADTEIDDAYFSAAANVCDELVTLSTGGTQKRYTCNGVIDTATAPLDNLNALISSLAGSVTYVQGKFRCHAAAYDSPVGTLDETHLAGPVKVRIRPTRKELFNSVKGTYVDPDKNWQPTDFPAVTNALYETQDGEKIVKDLDLTYTTHPEAAQRIAKVLLEKGRQGITVEMPVNHSALKYAVFDVVNVTNQQMGWSAKPFRIMKWSMGVPGPINLFLQEESSASYDWNSGEANTLDQAPDTNLPNPNVVSPPRALAVVESLYVTREGDGVKTSARLAWLASTDAFVREYQPEFKPSSASEWALLPTTTDTNAEILDIEPGIYDFRVKAVSTLGASSIYSTASRQIAGLLTPPVEPQSLTVSTIGGLAILRWNQSPDLDVRIGGNIVFRHSPDTAATWSQSTSIGNAVPGSTTVAVLPLKPGVYLAKAVDSSGIESVSPASVATEQATALAYANVTSLVEDPTFSGTKTNCYVDGGTLKLSGLGVVSGIPLVSAIASMAGYGGLASSGTYLFSGGVDLGSVRPVRLTSHIKATSINQLDLISSRTALVSTWVSVVGTSAAAGDAVVYVRHTNDNPAGSPTWSAWQRLDSGEFNARAFEAKLEMSTNDPAYNISISELSINVEEVA